MKIDLLDFTVSTSSHSTHTIEKELQINLNFSDILSQQLVTSSKTDQSNELKSLTVNWDNNSTTTYYPAWFDKISQCGQYDVQSADPLFGELGKTSSMLNMFFEDLVSCRTHNPGSGANQFQLSRIRQVAMSPMDLQNNAYSGYHYTEKQISRYYHEEEKGYSGTATLITKGGKRINFSFDVGLKRKFSMEDQITWKSQNSEVKLIEPVVFNLVTPLPKMRAVAFDFTLNNNHNTDTVNEIIPGSGFLELATYDPDYHIWIDVNDQIFNCLPI